MRRFVLRAGIYFLSIFVLIIVIQLCSMGVNNSIILPSIFEIFKSLIKIITESQTYLYIANTLRNLIVSLLFSFLIGMILGILGGLFTYVRLFLKPWITILRSIPLASSLVIIMILAGLSRTPYYVCSIMLIPIIYEGFCQGILCLDSTLMDVWKLNSNLSFKVLIRVHIPLIATHIKTAFISSVGMGIKVIIMAEYLAGIKNTLGSAILPAANMLDYGSVYAYSIIMVVLVLVLEALPKLLSKCISYIQFYYHQNKHKKSENA